MLSTGDTAPPFTATIGTSEHDAFDLRDHFGEGPVVLAFFPGVFTSTCTEEMVSFQDRIEEFRAAGATVFGISADSPFAQDSFREEHGLEFDLLSDMAREAIAAYDVETAIPPLGLHGIPKRAVFVLDGEGTVTYTWVTDDASNEPEYDAILSAVEAA